MNYRYFIREGNYFPFLICNEERGWYSTLEGNVHSNAGEQRYGIHFAIGNPYTYKESTLETILYKLGHKEYQDKLLNSLKITRNKIIEVPNHVKNRIIKDLTKHKAFNGDSAHKFKSIQEDVLYTLAEQKVIKSYDGQKFYLDKEE